MGIGTSRGMYYDDEFQHQAGVPTLPKGDEDMEKKPKDTGDDNVLPPEEGSYDKPTKGLTRVVITKPDPSENILDSDVSTPEPYGLNPPEGNAIQSFVEHNIKENIPNNLHSLLTSNIDDIIPNIPNRLSILNAVRGMFHGAEDAVKNSPQHLIDSVAQPLKVLQDGYEGKIPMFGVDPDTGETHVTPEGLAAAWTLLPYGIGGRMPTIQLRGPVHEALSQVGSEATANEQFQQLLRQVRRNQPSNIVEGGDFQPLRIPATGEISTHFEYNPVTNEYRPLNGGVSRADAEVEARRFSAHLGEDWNRVSPNDRERYIEGAAEQLHDQHLFRQEPFVEELTPAEHVGPNHHLSVHPDRMSDAEFYHWGEYQPENGMTAAQEERWLQLDQREGARLRPQDTARRQDRYTQEPDQMSDAEFLSWGNNITHSMTSDQEARWLRLWRREQNGQAIDGASPIPRSWNADIRQKLTTALNSKTIQMFKDSLRSHGRNHEFRFASENGVGKIELTERNAGKELHVDIMGKVNSSGSVDWDYGPRSFGNKDVKEMIKHLMKEFPKAEYITGFRVSGARERAGHGGMDARLNLPGRGNRD